MADSHALLALLEQGPAHGYTLKQRYDGAFPDVRPLAFGQVYASLSRFQRHGWAEILGVTAGDGPERKRYAITPDGVSSLDAWVYDAEPPEAFAASQLLTRVSVALLSGRPPERVLHNQRETHLRRMRALSSERSGTTDRARLLVITYQLAHLDADLRWIEEAGTRLAAQPHGQPQPPVKASR